MRRLYLFFASLTILGFFLDKLVVLALVSARNPLLNPIFVTITWIVLGFVALAIMIVLVYRKNHKMALVLACGALLAFSVSFALKYVFMRPRPFIELGITTLVTETSPSFPSTHAALATANLPVLAKVFPKYLWLWMLLACVILTSRLYTGVHYLSDVGAGALIGLICADAVLWWSERK